MQFVREGGLFKVVRVTGPTHNYLGLAFRDQEDAEVEIDVMDIRPGEPTRLKADEVKAEVLAGVDAANRSLGTSYRVRRIQFVRSDSPPVEIYRHLAVKLVERVERGEPFASVGN